MRGRGRDVATPGSDARVLPQAQGRQHAVTHTTLLLLRHHHHRLSLFFTLKYTSPGHNNKPSSFTYQTLTNYRRLVHVYLFFIVFSSKYRRYTVSRLLTSALTTPYPLCTVLYFPIPHYSLTKTFYPHSLTDWLSPPSSSSTTSTNSSPL